MAARTPSKYHTTQAKTDRSRPSFAARNEDTTLKYQPTPRDLFNPPPQATEYSNLRELSELRDKVWHTYSDFYDERYQILTSMLNILEEHEEKIGVKSWSIRLRA